MTDTGVDRDVELLRQRILALPESSALYEPVQYWQHAYHSRMERFTTGTTSFDTDIHVKEVVGTTHGDYINQRWIDFFRPNPGVAGNTKTGRRVPEQLEHYMRNPQYFDRPIVKDRIYVNRINNGALYIARGNHRVHLVKALAELKKHDGWIYRVKLTQYNVDTDLAFAYERLLIAIERNNVSLHPYIHRKAIGQNKVCHFISVVEPNGEQDIVTLESVSDIEEFIQRLSTPIYRPASRLVRWFFRK